MRNYTQFNLEYVFWEPGKGWHVALRRKVPSYAYSVQHGLDRVVKEDDMQTNPILIHVDEVCLHLKKLMEGLKHHLKSNTMPEDSYMDNYNALANIVGIYEQCRETSEDNSSAIISAVN